MAKRLALAVILCAAAGVAAADDKKVEPKAEPARKGEKWEYAELHYVAPRTTVERGFGGKGQPAPAPVPKAKLKVSWITGEGETEGESWEDLAGKLKVTLAKDAKPAAHKVKVLNHLGNQGWELVSSSGNVLTFKRRAVK
jgi:hypothetical protein